MQTHLRQPFESNAYLLAPEELPKPVDWSALFGNENPVEIEIGFGKGGFLVAMTQVCPAVNFLGIENNPKLVHYAAWRLAKRSVPNARLICADAHYILARFVPTGSIRTIHIYFPDPWHKSRHRRRRLLNAEFLPELGRVLSPGGKIQFATDYEDYFEQVQNLFAQFPLFQSQDIALWLDSRSPECMTNYETKYLEEGRSIYYALYERLATG